MKTTIDTDEKDKNIAKVSDVRLVYMTDPTNKSSEKNIGTYKLDLAQYTECSEKTELTCPLTGSRLESSAYLEVTIMV